MDMKKAVELKEEIEATKGKNHFKLIPPIIKKDNMIHVICKDEILIGRPDEEVFPDIEFTDRRISRPHLKISLNENKIVIEDLNSSGGTFINGDRIISRELKDGDMINLAKIMELQTSIYQLKDKTIGCLIFSGNTGKFIIIPKFINFTFYQA